MSVKGLCAELLLKAVRAYFVRRTVHWMYRLDGQILHRAEGKVISGRIDRGPAPSPSKRGDPVGMTLFWSVPGRPIYDMKHFPIFSLSWDKTLGWVFYE